jgi:nucleoside-diphosphate-sugar epimerase
MKKILITGGNGFAGGHCAIKLLESGYDVSILSRSKPTVPKLQNLPHIAADYVNDFQQASAAEILKGFDGLVFCAGNSIKNYDASNNECLDEFYHRVNSQAIPRFFAAAKEAGISRAVYLGSFYPQIAPGRIEQDAYVKSRHLADESIRAMSDTSFNVCSINAPYIIGHLNGLHNAFQQALVSYAKGELADMPVFAPPGGTNHVAVTAVAQALVAGLERGESGKAYLIGDENLSWQEYLQAWFSAAGNHRQIEARNEEHPLFPNAVMYAGIGATVSYEPAAEDLALLAYERGGVRRAMRDMIEYYSG